MGMNWTNDAKRRALGRALTAPSPQWKPRAVWSSPARDVSVGARGTYDAFPRDGHHRVRRMDGIVTVPRVKFLETA